MPILNSSAPHLIILGDPGIGKTYFGYFLLAHLARRGGTVVYQSGTSNCRYLLSSDRIEAGSKSEFSSHLLLSTTYYIVDASRPVTEDAKTVLLCSPRRDHWWEFNKTACTLRYMPVWSKDEIESCRRSLFPHITPELATTRFSNWGGIPRFVLSYGTDDIEQGLLDSAINSVDTVIRMRSLIKPIGTDAAPDDICHRLFHLTVDATSFDQRGHRFASDYVAGAVYRQLHHNCRQELTNFLAASSKIDSFAVLRGTLFECHAHVIIPRGGTFYIRELKDDNSVGAQSTLTLPLCDAVDFKDDTQLSSAADDLYLLPQSKNFEAVNAIIKPRRLFQMTISESHPCKQASLHRVLNWLHNPVDPQLYFVVPRDVFDSFRYQKYADASGKILKNGPTYSNVKNLRQYVLGISLAS